MAETHREYDQFIAPLQERMTRSIWRIVRNADDVEDVLQDALTRIIVKMRQIRRHPNSAAFILRICVHCALDHARRKRNRQKTVERAAEIRSPLSADSSPDQALMQAEQRDGILRSLANLPRREAEAMTLLVSEELSYPEAAQAMGCRESTVRVLAWKARRRLRKELTGKGILPGREENDHA